MWLRKTGRATALQIPTLRWLEACGSGITDLSVVSSETVKRGERIPSSGRGPFLQLCTGHTATGYASRNKSYDEEVVMKNRLWGLLSAATLAATSLTVAPSAQAAGAPTYPYREPVIYSVGHVRVSGNTA